MGRAGAFGHLLRKLRETAGLTQQELAERARLGTNTISSLERGERRRPYLPTVRLLADALDLSDEDRAALLASARPGGQPAPESAPPRPAQLPSDVADFTGRHEEVAWIASLLQAAARGGAERAPVVAIAGKAGVGKSALAVHVAHRLRPHFPDGQLYADLHSGGAETGSVLAGFLLALGVGGETLPADLAAQTALYRSLLADAQVLVVLDNARDEGQIRHLVPGGPGCGLLVTSRSRLTALEGVEVRDLEDMDVDDALDLLGRISGSERVQREPRAAVTIARLCGGLPLALRIAGATLKAKRHWSLERLVDRLEDEHRRLDELHIADLDVRASFALTYADLSRDEARLFRLLGLLPGPDFTVPLVAAAAGSDVRTVERLLENLHSAQLLAAPAGGRHRLHDLLRLFARERVEREEPAGERLAAAVRAIGWYEEMARDAAAALRRADRPGDEAALAWFRSELPGLVAAVARAGELERFDLCLALADALEPFFVVQEVHSRDQERIQQAGLAAARRLDDRAGQGRCLLGLGDVQRNQGRWVRAIECYEQALTIFRHVRDRRGEAQALLELGRTYRKQSRWPEACAHQELSLAIFRLLGDRQGEGRVLNSLGLVYEFRGWFAFAISCYEQSLDILRRVGDRHFEGWVLSNLGDLHRTLGRLEEAVACCQAGLDIYRQLGDRDCETWALRALGRVRRDQGRWSDAIGWFERSLDGCQEHGDREGEAKTLANLSSVLREQGGWAEAESDGERSVTIFRQLGDRHGESAALNCLGAALRERGRWDEAARCHELSLEIGREIGDRVGQAETMGHLGLLNRRRGRWADAVGWHEQGLDLCRQFGDRRGEAAALELLGEAHREAGAWESALDCHTRGLDLRRHSHDRAGEARSLACLADVLRDQGRLDEAIAGYRESLDVSALLGDARAGDAATLVRLAETLGRAGRPTEEAAAYERGRAVAEGLGDRLQEAAARAGLERLGAGWPHSGG